MNEGDKFDFLNKSLKNCIIHTFADQKSNYWWII